MMLGACCNRNRCGSRLVLLSQSTVGEPGRSNYDLLGNAATKARKAMRKIRVLLADDNETILARVRAVLREEFEIVGSVNNGRDAITEVQRLDPDVLVIDISMPILDGLQAVSRLGPGYRTKFVFLTVHEDQDFVDAAFAIGASGYVAKSDVSSDLAPAILEVVEGRKYISKSIMQ